MASALASQWALEVPIAAAEPLGDAATREVPALGDPAFELPGLPPGTARAGRSEANQGQASLSRCLVWRLEGDAPQHLLLQEAALNEDRRDGAARLAFVAPLLPAVSCAQTQQGSRVAAVTADGALHTFLHTYDAAGGSGRPSLARQLLAPDALTSVPLAAQFVRAGAPTTLLEVGGYMCIGTAEGNVVCLPAGATSAAAAFQLTPTSGFTKMLGGFFGQRGGHAVRQLMELRHMEQSLLAALHEGGQLRLWDLSTRTLVHSADLLTTPQQASWLPTLARLTAEPLDASSFILCVYFDHVEEGSGEPGMLTLYELFLEQRGEGAYKVLVERGTSMQRGSRVHRLQDMALENLALHTVGAWLLYDSAAGERHLHCVPLSFGDSSGPAATEVLLIEDQIKEGCQADASLAQQEEEAWRAAESQLGAAPAALPAAFADAVLAPARLSKPALAAALAALGSSARRDDVMQADLTELKQHLTRWVAGTAGGTATVGSAAGGAAVLAKWSALLHAYAAAWRQQHAPLALLQLPRESSVHGLLLARRGGMVTALRPGAAPELALRDCHSLLAEVQHGAGGGEAVALVLEAAAAVFDAAGGGQLARLLWACMQEGQDLGAAVLPALVHSLAAGGTAAAQGSSGGSRPGAASAHAQWRAACRKLPLKLAQLCSGAADSSAGGFAAAVEATLQVLSSHYRDAGKLRSALPALATPIRSTVLGTLAQVAWAQLQVVSQLALLLRYVLWSQALASWSLPPEDGHRLETALLPRVLDLLQAAALAYWAAVTPVAGGGAGGAGGAAARDPAQMVVALRIGAGPPAAAAAGGAAAKRACVAQPPQDAYAASLLLAAVVAGGQAQRLHVVRDLPDLQRVALLFSQRLLCLAPSPAHAGAAGQRLNLAQGGAPAAASDTLTPADMGVEVCSALFWGRHTRQLAAVQHLLPDGTQDMRLLFFRACSRVREIAGGATPEDQARLEEESVCLFFRAAAVFSPAGAAAFPGQAAAVARCVEQMRANWAQGGASAGEESLEATEQHYFEALFTLYERQGRPGAAARCALAAARAAAGMAPPPGQELAHAAVQGRLWANVFSCMMEARRFEEAYVAVLSIEAAEVQLDCLHRLLAGLCASPGGGVELLCRLPWAHNMLLLKGGRQAWVPMVEEVVATLQRRAAQLDLRAAPQPYKVLADFHISRNNYQAAAGAQLAYARRLVWEHPDDPQLLQEAEHALAAAVSCLSLVERQQAWVEDLAGGGDGVDGEEAGVLTLAALQREYAVVRAHAALAAAMPGSRQGHASLSAGAGEGPRGGGADDVFSQLLALDLHDDAFQLAEAAFVGTQLTRALERAFASLAAACVVAQMARGRVAGAAGPSASASAAAGGGGDDMDTEEGTAGTTAVGAAGSRAAGGAALAVADWRRLKAWLQRHEGGEHQHRLRLVILEALLQAEPAFMLPPWLMAAFKPVAPLPTAAAASSGGSADLAGALRVLMKHGRLADAAALAAQHLQAALAAVPSVGMARTSQVCFPAALLDQLVAQLRAAGGRGLAGEAARVAALLQRVRGAALGQTLAIQQVFA